MLSDLSFIFISMLLKREIQERVCEKTQMNSRHLWFLKKEKTDMIKIAGAP